MIVISEENRNIIETVIITLFMNLIAIIGVNYIPLVLIIYPIPFVVLGVKNGLKYSLISMLMVSTVIGMTMGIVSVIILLGVFAPMTILITLGIKHRRKALEITAIAALLFFVALMLLYGYSERTTGINIRDQMEVSFQQLIQDQIENLEEMGLTNTEISQNIDNIENSYRVMMTILPVTLVLAAISISYLNFLISALILRRVGIGVVNIPAFSRFKLPNDFILGTIVMFITVYIFKYLNISNADAVNINLMIFIWFMAMIQGLAIVDFFLIKIKVKLVPRMMLLFTLAVMGVSGTLVSLVGLLDILFDFRKIRPKKS